MLKIKHYVMRHPDVIMAVLLITLVIFVQWPMFKGFFYRAAAPQAVPDGIAWRKNYAAALAEAQKTNQPLLLDFHADWCPPCQVMKHETWPDPQVRDLVNGHFIPVALDDDQPESAEPARLFRVYQLPTILIIDPHTQRPLHQASMLSASQMRSFLAQARQSYKDAGK